MKKPAFKLTAVLVLTLSFCAFCLEIGDSAPNISLPTLDSTTFNLSAHLGTVVVLYTFGCT